MECTIDMDRLRKDMKEYYGIAMFNGFPMAVIDLAKMEHLSDQELFEMARRNRVDLRKYIVG